ncbi:MAG: hypothetical protein OEY38_00720 [Gammaproteobacteria bacterium]|nr:hypothetical protein [Gammaproteobacteria bacterium]
MDKTITTDYTNTYNVVEIVAVNTSNEMAGIANVLGLDLATLWYIDPNDQLIKAYVLDNTHQNDGNNENFVVTGMSNSNETNDSHAYVSGYYTKQDTGKRQAVLWYWDVLTTQYKAVDLKPYTRDITLCPSQISGTNTECYFLNPDGTTYDAPNKHAPTSLCDNSAWMNTIPTAYTVECDDETIANSVNQAGVVAGVSFHKTLGTGAEVRRPVYWYRTDTTEETTREYTIASLGSLLDVRPDEDPTPEILTDNTAVINRIYFWGEVNSIDERLGLAVGQVSFAEQNNPQYPGPVLPDGETKPPYIYPSFDKNYPLTFSEYKDAHLATTDLPATWHSINVGGEFLGPFPIPHRINNCDLDPNETKNLNNEQVHNKLREQCYKPLLAGESISLQSIASGIISGWYNDGGVSHARVWSFRPRSGENPYVIKQDPAVLEDYITTEVGYSASFGGPNSKALFSNTLEYFGEYETASPVAQVPGILIQGCGLLDVNDLSTIRPNSPYLELLDITSNYPSNMLIKDVAGAYHYLQVSGKNVDLSVNLETNVETLTVGDRHTYVATITNNSPDILSENNFATCVTLRVESKVVLTSASRTEDQQPGGITFSNPKSSSNIASCSTDEVGVTCLIGLILPQQTIAFTIDAEPRPLLADRLVQTEAVVSSVEEPLNSLLRPETGEALPADKVNNKSQRQIYVERSTSWQCFIATAAYGSYLEPEVQILRDFRDQYLLNFKLGRWLVDKYYFYSPPIANFIAQHENVRRVTRWSLTPLVIFAKYPTMSSLTFLSVLIMALSWNWRRRID